MFDPAGILDPLRDLEANGVFQGVEVNGHADYPPSLRRISNIFSGTSSSSGGG
jgi:hypothetical protein